MVHGAECSCRYSIGHLSPRRQINLFGIPLLTISPITRWKISSFTVCNFAARSNSFNSFTLKGLTHIYVRLSQILSQRNCLYKLSNHLQAYSLLCYLYYKLLTWTPPPNHVQPPLPPQIHFPVPMTWLYTAHASRQPRLIDSIISN